jgi:glycosyltransferase involved in cell wall biosynthesis
MQSECVLHVDAERGFSGGEVQVFLLMAGLRARGWRQALACPPGSEAEARARQLGFEVFAVPMRYDLDLLAVGRLGRAIRNCGAGLAHLHTGRATWLGGLAARRAGIRAVTTRRMDRRVRRNLRNRLIYGSLVDAAVGIAPAVSRLLIEAGVPAAKVRTIWSTVDPERLEPTAERETLRAGHGLGPRTVVVLSAASLVRRKGLDLLLEAFARTAPGRDTVLWLAGDGPERTALETRAARPDLAGRVRFLGRTAAVADLLAAADLVAMPSRAEGLGIAALEAMASGRPVLATRVGGLGEAVVDGRTGLLVPPEDVAALEAGLRRLIDDPGLRARLGAGGAEHVRAHFLPDRMVEAYELLYRGLLASRR